MTKLSPAAQAILDAYNQDPFANTGYIIGLMLGYLLGILVGRGLYRKRQ